MCCSLCFLLTTNQTIAHRWPLYVPSCLILSIFIALDADLFITTISIEYKPLISNECLIFKCVGSVHANSVTNPQLIISSQNQKMAFSTVKAVFTKYPVVKGMLAYSITWPTGNIIQQHLAGKRWGNSADFFFRLFLIRSLKPHFNSHVVDTYDWNECICFSLYGSLYVAPTLFGWIKLTSRIWPVSNFRTALAKTLLEQISYGPVATASFFFLISLLENKTIEESKQEVKDKFWPTYKVYHPHSIFY